MIQSLENFVSMAIQGTHVPMYTKYTLFLYFSDFSIFFFMKNKIKKKTKKQPNKNILNKAKHKTRLTQKKAKHTRNATKNKKIERKVIESLGAIFLPHPGRILHLIKPLNRR